MSDNEVNVRFGAETSGFTAGVSAVTSAQRGMSQSLLADMAAYDAASAAASAGAEKAAEGAAKLNFATAGATREFIVLGREALTGNFSRIPGSLLTLANRTGGLQTVMASVTGTQIAWVAAIGATIAVLYEWMEADDRVREAQSSVAGAMELVGRSASFNAQAVADNILYMREYENVSSSAAEEIVEKFSRIPNVTSQMQAQLVRFVEAWQRITNAKDSEHAAESMAKVFEDPAKGAEELAKKFPALVSAEQAWTVQQDEAKNGAEHAAQTLLEVLTPALKQQAAEAEKDVHTWERLKRVMVDVGNLSFTSLSTGTFGLAGRQAEQGATQDTDAQQQQEHQIALNADLQKALDIAKGIHAEDEQINTLTQKRAELLKGVNAAMEQGDDDAAAKLQVDIKIVDDKIVAEDKRMNAARVEAAKKANEQIIEVEREKAGTERELNNIQLQATRESLQAQVDAGTITKQQQLFALKELVVAEEEQNEQELENQKKIGDLTLAERQRIDDQILISHAKALQQLDLLDQQEAQNNMALQKKAQQEYVKDWDSAFNVVDRSLDGMLQGTLQGTEKWQQAMAKLYSNLALTAIEELAKVALRLAALQAAKGFTALTGLGGGATSALASTVPTALGGTQGAAGSAAQTANTTALTANTSALTSLLTALGINTTSTTTDAASTDINAASTDANAASTEMNTVSSDSGILAWAANTAATIANTVATWVGDLKPFDVGTSSLPFTGPILAHQGEMILPPNISAQVRAGNTVIGSGSGLSAGGGGSQSTQINVTALDAKSVVSLFNNPSIMRQLAKNMGSYSAMNPSVRGNY
jgi:hypothetical protein